MPQLTIGDKSVTVGDEFLQLSPADQNAAVQHIAEQIGAGGGASAESAAPAAPVSANDVARSAASGVPIVGGALNKLDAATNAALAPVLNRFFAPENQLSEPSFSERYAHSLRDQEGADTRFATNHPVIDTGVKLAGGIASMVPVMNAAPAAFGLAGPMSTMIRNGALSGAAVSGADALVRGEDPTSSAAVGGVVGGLAGPVGKGVGKLAAAIADRVRPAAPVPQNLARVGNVDIPLSAAEVSQDPATSAEQQILLRGGRGVPAQQNAQAFKDMQDARVNQARNEIGAGLDPTGASAQTSPQDAAERIASELIAAEQAKQAAQAGVHAGPMSPAQQGEDIARSFGPVGSSNEQAERIAAELAAQEQTRQATEVANRTAVAREGGNLAQSLTGSRNVLAPHDAAELLSERLAAARGAAKSDYRGKYNAVAEQPGAFAPGSAAGFRGDVENGLRNGDNPVSLDATNTPKSLQALKILDDRLNLAGPGAPKVSAAAAELGPEHAQNVSDIRARFGDDVAAAYDRQKAAAVPEKVITSPNDVKAPNAQSLLEFLASKGGLGPDQELEAIGAHGHTVNVEGVGRRKLVKQGGLPLDYAREAAQEAGYLHGDHNGTSGVNDLLDAIDAEMRGKKRYPDGFEGTVSKREGAARTEREQHEFDAHMRGFEDDLAAAGHGELGADVKARAVHLMANEGMDADTAVEHSLRQLEQEDNAVASAFPGDRAAPKASAAPEQPGSGFGLRDVEQVRKQLSTLYGDARRAMMAGGSGADVHALEHIMSHFDARVEAMIADGKFSGDGPAVLQMQKDARAAFSDYKQKFAKRGAGDTIGAAVEKILGKFSDTKATPDAIVNLAYGSASSPGGQMPVQVAQRISKIFGRDSAEFGTYKQGLFAHLTAGEPEKAAARIDEFLNGTKGKLLSQVAFDPAERAQLARYADRLRSTAPGEVGPTPSANKILRDLMGASGTGTGVNAPETALELKRRISPEGWNRVRAMAFRELTRDGDPAEIASRIDSFLTGSNSKMLAQNVFDAGERANLARYADRLRGTVPQAKETGPLAATLRRITGADGGAPASANEIASQLYGATGKGAGRVSVALAEHLKANLSKEGWAAVRQGMWEKLTNAGEGKIQFEAQALSQRLHEFLNESGSQLAKTLYSPRELQLMKDLASVYKQMIPVKGTTNPSGTAPMLAKIASGTRHTLLPLLGFTHGGVPGAAAAMALDKGLQAIGNNNAARSATRLFYGNQPTRPINPNFAKLSGLLAQGDDSERNQRRRVR